MKLLLTISGLVLTLLASGQPTVKEMNISGQYIRFAWLTELDNEQVVNIIDGFSWFHSTTKLNDSTYAGSVLTSNNINSNRVFRSAFDQSLIIASCGQQKIQLARLDTNGQMIADAYCNFMSTDLSTIDVMEFSNGHLLVRCDNSLRMFNSSLNLVWIRNFSISGEIKKAIHFGNDKIILTHEAINGPYSFFNIDFAVACIDTNGNQLWGNYYGNEGMERLTSAFEYENKFYLSGYSIASNGAKMYGVITCIDTAGTLIWSNNYDFNLSGKFIYGEALADGSLLFLARTSNSVNNFVFINPSGFVESSFIINDSAYFNINSFLPNSDSSFSFMGIDSLKSSLKLVTTYQHELPECIQVEQSIVQVVSSDAKVTVLVDRGYNSNFDICNGGFLIQKDTLIFTTGCINSCNLTASILNDAQQECINSPVVFRNNSLNASSFQWLINDSLVSTDSSFIYSFPSSGIYSVTLVASNGLCSDSAFLNILISDFPTASFNIIGSHYDYSFYANPNTDFSHTWDFGDGNSVSSMDSAYHIYNTGTYNVCLQATNVCGSTMNCKMVTTTINEAGFHKTYQSIPSGSFLATSIVQKHDGGFFIMENQLNYYQPRVIETDWVGNCIGSYSIYENSAGSGIFVNPNYKMSKLRGRSVFFSGTEMGFSSMQYVLLELRNSRVYQHFINGITPVNSDGDLYALNDSVLIIASSSHYKAALGKKNLRSNSPILEWKRRYHQILLFHAIEAMEDSGYMVLGIDTTQSNLVLLKVNDHGIEQWAKLYSGGLSPVLSVKKMIYCKDGNLLFSGNDGNNCILFKTDTLGNVIWSYNYSLAAVSNTIKSCAEALDGNIYFTGGFNAGRSVLCKVDKDGLLVDSWSYPIIFNSIVATADTGIALTGHNFVGGNLQQSEIYKFRQDTIIGCDAQVETVTQTPYVLTLSNYLVTSDDTLSGMPSSSFFLSGKFMYYDSLICMDGSMSINAYFPYSSACLNVPFQFTNQSVGDSLTYQWNFPGAVVDTSSLQNPVVVWNQTGVYNVTLTVFNNNGETSSYSRNVAVRGAPVVSTTDKTVCKGSPILLSCSGINISSVNWSPSTYLTSATGQFVTSTPMQDIVYQLNVTDYFGCMVTDSVVVTTIQPLPVTTSIPDSVCDSEQILLSATGSVKYQWFNNGSLINSSSQVPPFNLSPGIYEIAVFGTDSNQCIDSVKQILTVLPEPSFSITPSGTIKICDDDTVVLQTNAIGSIQWFNRSIALAGETLSSFTATNAGNYSCEVVDSNGCMSRSAAIQIRIVCIQSPNDNQIRLDLLSSDANALYPNPSKGEFFIQLSDYFEGMVHIYNILGEEVFARYMQSNAQNLINLNVALESGVYQVAFDDNSLVRFRLVLVD